jgi:Zn-dependent metalloprotease
MKLRPAVVLAASFALVAATAVGTAQAQPTNSVAAQSADAMAVDAAASLVASRPAVMHASADDVFTARPVISSGGLKYVPYDRTYKGLPVIGGDMVVATNSAGQVLSTSVAQDKTISLPSLTPTVSKQQAQQTARGLLATVDSVGAATLVTYALGDAPRLAWESTVVGRDAEGPSRLSVVVDALNGTVLHTQEHVMNGDGTSGWNAPNPVHLDTTQSGSTFSLKDPGKTNVSCQDAANNTTFSGPDDLWGNGNPTSKETGCVDALFAVQTENKMLSQWVGRNGADGNGGGWPVRVGLADLNAFYDGTQVQIGHNQANQWISSLDVVAHEHGHGVDDHTPGGISGSGTQEFVADVFGTSAEWFANEPAAGDPPDFTIGERINLVGTGPIRVMYKPDTISGHPNCYSSSVPGMEVHAAAGPGNHWFYLLAEGTNPTDGQPVSPTCNSTTSTGLGVQTAFKIFYNAMLLKTSGASYLKYRTWTLTAAKNMFPGSCVEFDKVKAAWDAVSVPAQAADPTCAPSGGAVTVTNPGSQSSTIGTPASLTLAATGGTAPYTWTAAPLPAGLSVNASTGVISGTPTTAGTTTVTATASDSSNPKKTGSAQFSWTVGSTPPACSGQLLGNPGFETATAPWTATAGVIDNSSGQAAHGGTWKAWLNGYGSSHTDTLSQSVAIPANCKATLSFFLHIDTAETGSTQFDKLTVTAGSTTLASFSNVNAAAGYAQKTFDVSAFAGQTVVIKFNGVEDSSLQTSFVVDDTALTLG